MQGGLANALATALNEEAQHEYGQHSGDNAGNHDVHI